MWAVAQWQCEATDPTLFLFFLDATKEKVDTHISHIQYVEMISFIIF